MNFENAGLQAAGGVRLVLRLGAERWRTRGAAGCEVAPCPPVAPVPGAPRWLLGLVVHKGEALPLLDLGVALEREIASTAPTEGGRVLITRSGGTGAAFLVDDVDADDGRDGVQALDLDALTRDLLARAGAPDVS